MIVEAELDALEALELVREDERIERLWAKDRWNHFAVYQVRADKLSLNVANRRFRAERLDVERQLGRPLDTAEHPEDAEAVIALALDQNVRVDERRRVIGTANPATATLADDWKRRRQERPMWVRPDGTIVNGNRRWAMLRRLQELEDLDGFEYVDVIVLGHEFDGPELFHMEAREQLTEGLKVRYGDVNLLLTLREAADLEDVDWGDRDDIHRVAGVIRGLARNDQTYTEIQLTAVKYMVAYLEEIEAPEDFRRMEGRVERFRDVARNMMRVQDIDPDRELKMLDLCFAAVRSNNQHGDLRELRRMLIEQTELFDELFNKVTTATDAVGGILPEPDPGAGAGAGASGDADDDGEAEDAGQGPADYEPVRDLINVQVQAARTTRESLAKSVRLAHAMLEKVGLLEVGEILSADAAGDTTAAVEGVVAWSTMAGRVLDERRS